MSSYLVYIPGAISAKRTEAALEDVGLAEIIDKEFAADVCDCRGPDGERGLLFRWQDQRRLDLCPSINIQENHWTPAQADAQRGLPAKRFWLGRSKYKRVSPEALLRRRWHSGEDVLLDDGQAWTVPIARQLPHRHGMQGRVVKSQYRAFFDRAMEYQQRALDLRNGVDVVLAGGWRFGVEALAMNYRVNADVIDWLELVTDANIMWLVGATFEMCATDATDAQKKKVSVGTPAT